MSVHRKGAKWVVRYRDGGRNRSRSFDRKSDAERFDAEARRRRQLGALPSLDAGRDTVNDFVTDVWAPTHAVTLAPKTRIHYASLYDHHIAPHLGACPLRELRAELIGRGQADRLAAGAGRVAVRQALDLLGGILQHAVECERIHSNPARLVRKARPPRRQEVRPLAPRTIEAMRLAASARDATLVSVLAYAGLRPGEALALRWSDIRKSTILVERALALGEEDDTKTRQHRTVRLLGPLRGDLAEWRLACGRPGPDALVFPNHRGENWTLPAYQSWRRRAFRRAVQATAIGHTTPYALRHSFASLLLHEGRSVIYVARQLGHDARLTLTRYGHVIDELDDQPRVDAETAIREARVPSQFPKDIEAAANPKTTKARTPRTAAEYEQMELGGLEPPTSWVRSRRSPN